MNYIVDTESSNNNSNTMMDNDEEMCKYGALFLTSLQAIGLLLYGLVTQEHDYSTSDLDLGPSQALLSPDITWSSFVDAMLTWVFTGTMLLVETMAVAEKPKEYKKALGYSIFIVGTEFRLPREYRLWEW